LVHVKKIDTKLNKNQEYKDKIKYKILDLTRGTHGHLVALLTNFKHKQKF